jgi:WD40 repeat protein
MATRFLSALTLFAFTMQFVSAGDTAKSRLDSLQRRVVLQEFANDTLRRDLLAFAREHVGTPLYAKAIDALRHVPAPLDKLDENAIDAEDRKLLSIRGLVGYVRPHGRAIASVAISFDGTLLATSSWDNRVHLYKLGGKEPISWATLDASPSGIAFSPDGKFLATGCAETNVILWNLTGEKPTLEQRLSGHKQRPFSVAFSPKHKMLASGAFDPVLRIWKLDDLTPEVWSVIANEKTSSRGIASLAFSHDGKYLVGGSHFGRATLRMWDVSGKSPVDAEPPNALARTAACSPTEPILAFAGDDGNVHLWNIGKTPIEKLRTIAAHTGKNLPPIVKALAFSPDGKTVASSGQDKALRLWNVATGELRRDWSFLDEARALAFSRDGRHLAVGNSDGTLYLLRLDSARMKGK